ncbi:MAG: hypothetical protein GTN62_00035 [Gemmatimonadales bacterium]|nr:hypothetical protein [Gemmatimonadales bacterium]NIP05962.1 hypothetical protein [Gemmatimonadales bacterium]NIR02476.1 hypothetical protein [Gemmatimonadales bacterium]NIS66252.1 hypothetical protein [Gemmatimonadales bacterium]
MQVCDDRWLGSFQWVRGIAVSERHIIAGVTQWRKDAPQRPQMPPRLVFYDRATKRFEGDLFLPPVEGFPMACIFTIHVIAPGAGETLDPSRWSSGAPEAQLPEAAGQTAAPPRLPAPCLHFHSSADRTALSSTWSYPPGPRRRIRVLPEGSLWIDVDLNEEEHFYVRTGSGPFSAPPDDPIPLGLQPGRTYEVSVFCNRVRGEPHLQLWLIQYGKRDRLCHEVRTLTWGHNRLPFTCDPRLHAVCLAFRVAGRGVAHLAPVDLSAVGP